MIVPLFVATHWYTSFFLQSFFHHRYAAHRHFLMSERTGKFFFFLCFLAHGSSYMSPYAYGIMHRLHHIHTDTEEDPHSPHNEPNFFKLWFLTRNNYQKIYTNNLEVDSKLKKDLPTWEIFDRFASNWITRSCWIVLYITFYVAYSTSWWMYLLLPLTITMAAFQGTVINWWAHKFGYVNYKLKNTSKNILPVDFIFIGDAYHNNHHKFPGRPKNSNRWFETDLIYAITNLMSKLHIVQWKNS
ncbi:MAG: fatty acid desaturase [Ginsengibacter sp.]